MRKSDETMLCLSEASSFKRLDFFPFPLPSQCHPLDHEQHENTCTDIPQPKQPVADPRRQANPHDANRRDQHPHNPYGPMSHYPPPPHAAPAHKPDHSKPLTPYEQHKAQMAKERAAALGPQHHLDKPPSAGHHEAHAVNKWENRKAQEHHNRPHPPQSSGLPPPLQPSVPQYHHERVFKPENDRYNPTAPHNAHVPLEKKYGVKEEIQGAHRNQPALGHPAPLPQKRQPSGPENPRGAKDPSPFNRPSQYEIPKPLTNDVPNPFLHNLDGRTLKQLQAEGLKDAFKQIDQPTKSKMDVNRYFQEKKQSPPVNSQTHQDGTRSSVLN